MPEEVKNYLSLDRLSLRHKYFAFLDVREYLADGLFIKHQVTVKFVREYCRDDSPYLIILCRIKKRDETAFLNALGDLTNKMLLCGYLDYPAQCLSFIEKVEIRGTKERMCSHGVDDAAAKAEQT